MHNPNVHVVFQDEVHFQQTTSVARIWANKGSKPQVASAPNKKSVSLSGYVFPETGKLIINQSSWFNYESVIQSFRDFIVKANIPDGEQVALVIDNAPWHKKAYRLIVDEELPEFQDIRDKLILIKMPTYSPDLNPIEQRWRIVRREVTHNRFFESLSQLEDKLFNYFSKFLVPNDKFKSLCSFGWLIA